VEGFAVILPGFLATELEELTTLRSRTLQCTRRLAISYFASLAAASPNLAQTIAPQPKIGLTPAQMRDDLSILRTEWAPLDKSFSDQQRQLFDLALDDAIAKTATRSIPDFALDIMQAVAIPRNGHTAAMVGHALHDLPIRMWWFADGLFIVSVRPMFGNLLGARVEKLGSLTPDEALLRVGPYISGTDQHCRYLSAVYLASPDVLCRINAAADASAIPLALRLPDGSSHMVSVSGAPEPDPGDRHEPFYDAYSARLSAFLSAWRSDHNPEDILVGEEA
jgi:hypothetical protein